MDYIFDENQPIYLQIIQRIRFRIFRGEFKPGDKLPGVVEAAMYYKVNHNTIQRVYGELIRDGVAISKRGEGTFVTEDTKILEQLRTKMQATFLEIFTTQMAQLGYSDAEMVALLRTYLIQHGSTLTEEAKE